MRKIIGGMAVMLVVAGAAPASADTGTSPRKSGGSLLRHLVDKGTLARARCPILILAFVDEDTKGYATPVKAVAATGVRGYAIVDEGVADGDKTTHTVALRSGRRTIAEFEVPLFKRGYIADEARGVGRCAD